MVVPASARQRRSALWELLNSSPRDALAQASRSRLFRAIVENSGDVLLVVDGGGQLAYLSPSVKAVLGYSPRELLRAPLANLLAEPDAAAMREMLRAAAADPEQTCRLEAIFRHATGEWVPCEVTVTALLHDPHVQGFVVTVRDVGERKRLEHALTRQAYSDALTGLPNRVLFQARVEQALRQRPYHKTGVALLFCDLDGFKAVNDVQGHAAGDQLLKVVAARLTQCVRPHDTVARLGGDEFAVLLMGPDIEQVAVEIAERIAAFVAEPIPLPDRSAHVGTSIGLAVSAPWVTDADTLLRQADLAMYEAKRRATGHWMRFEPGMLSELAERAEIENDLRLASANRQLAVVYQPLRDIATGRLVGAEALLRWRHPKRGFIPPDRFVRIAEQIGLINQLGTWVLAEACRAGQRWQEAARAGAEAGGGDGVFHVSVNISARQLHGGLVDDVRRVLEESGLPPEALLLEVTETVLMEKVDEAVALLRELKALGVRIAVDDFGTGYSSLSYLARFPVDVLKIDRSFVERLTKQEDADELVRMIIGLGRALSLRIVAEGVETGSQLEALRGMGCDLAQGFLFMRPVPDWCIDELLSGSESPEQQGALIPLQSSPVEATPVGLAPAAVFPGAVPAMLPGSAMPDQLGA